MLPRAAGRPTVGAKGAVDLVAFRDGPRSTNPVATVVASDG
jgi:hypothetical protein